MRTYSDSNGDGPRPGSGSFKVAVLSDTHGNYPLAIRLLDRIPGLAGIIHLGDNLEDADAVALAMSRPITRIAGNCDTASDAPRELLLSKDDTTVFMTHGHLYDVKTGIERLFRRVAGENIRVVLYGHTHLPSIVEREGILFVNPGALGKNTTCQSIALLTISRGGVSAEIIEANRT